MDNLSSLLTPWAYFFCTAFAACVGSFSNVVIWRVPRHESIAYPPSACPKCGNRIKWYDNIPILSWLILRGKCRGCHEPISPRYIIIEAISAGFGALLCHQIVIPSLPFFFVDGVIWQTVFLFFSLMLFAIASLALAMIDYDTTELPPQITLPMAGLGLLTAWLIPENPAAGLLLGNIDWVDSLLGCVIGGGIVISIIGLYYLATKRIGMGGGDIWMMMMMGAFLGWEALPFIFLAASVQGIIGAVIGMIVGSKQQKGDDKGLFRNEVAQEIDENAPDDPSTGKLAVPFGPFIALAGVEYLFLGDIVLPLMSSNALTPWGMLPLG